MPIDPIVLLAFVPASLALNLTPGADMFFCLGQGLEGGRRAALAAASGLAFGAAIGVTIAGLGLGMVVASYPVLLQALKWLGIAYLLWLARQALKTEPRPVAAARRRRPFFDGVAIALANPKGLLFVLAFLPQFIEESRPVLPQFLTLGAVLTGGGFIVNACVGCLAGTAHQTLAESQRAVRWMRRITATLYGALALKLARASL